MLVIEHLYSSLLYTLFVLAFLLLLIITIILIG